MRIRERAWGKAVSVVGPLDREGAQVLYGGLVGKVLRRTVCEVQRCENEDEDGRDLYKNNYESGYVMKLYGDYSNEHADRSANVCHSLLPSQCRTLRRRVAGGYEEEGIESREIQFRMMCSNGLAAHLHSRRVAAPSCSTRWGYARVL